MSKLDSQGTAKIYVVLEEYTENGWKKVTEGTGSTIFNNNFGGKAKFNTLSQAIGNSNGKYRIRDVSSGEIIYPRNSPIGSRETTVKDMTTLKTSDNREAEETEEELMDHEPIEKSDALNLILYGPPGTGKTYHTINYALAMIEGKSIEDIDSEEREELLVRFNEFKAKGQIEFITFHQSYSYEDFIQGIRPDVNNSGGLSFELKDGLFKKIADRALKNYQDNEEHNNYVIIIDEINRANISRVFGELITLIEKDKRYDGSNALSTTLPSGESFTVPPNLYILGTVNTADKSIALLDLALRRRFEFIKMYPNPVRVIAKYRELFKKLNDEIINKKGPDFQIGHSYFMADEDNFNLKDTMNLKVIPLLYEYFMNDGETVNKILISAGIKTTSIMGLYEFESYSG